MNLFAIVAMLITFTAVVGYVNERFVKLPTTIGVMVGGLVTSLLVIGAAKLGIGGQAWVEGLVGQIDFNRLLMHGMLSFLLFAGALHVNMNELLDQRRAITLLATVGVVISTILVGTLMYYALQALGIGIPYIACVLFGALISPTDPVAVLSVLKRARTPKSVELLITGESLFNDGVGVVIFTILLELAYGESAPSVVHGLELFARDALGGAAYGLALGFLAVMMLRRVDNFTVEVLITLALVTGGYALAQHFHISGPLAMVMAGIVVGNQGRQLGMSERTRAHLDPFWVVVDEVLNALLFLLIGLEILIIEVTPQLFLVGLLAIPVVLLARWLSVGGAVTLIRLKSGYPSGTVRMMTWGGLRGGIAIALALSLPADATRETIIYMTYAVVVFSMLVQGLTVGRLAARQFAA